MPSKKSSLETRITAKRKKHIKSALKLLITGWAVFYVLKHIDTKALLHILKTADLRWLAAAFLAFNASKVVSAFRLNIYFRAIGVTLNEWINLRLYYLGMFYNLFLPGGISGDGYKIYLLRTHNNTGYKKLFQATLLDRISGLSALLFLAGLLFIFSTFAERYPPLGYLAILGTVSVIPANYYLTKRFFRDYLPTIGRTTLYAFAVQLLQLFSAAFIVLSLPSHTAMMTDYLTLFLISSVVAVLPISVGGIGVRELTFLYGFGLIDGDTTMAVTFSLIFFLITALSSLLGAVIKIDHRQLR